MKMFDFMWTKVYLTTINSEYGSKNIFYLLFTYKTKGC